MDEKIEEIFIDDVEGVFADGYTITVAGPVFYITFWRSYPKCSNVPKPEKIIHKVVAKIALQIDMANKLA